MTLQQLPDLAFPDDAAGVQQAVDGKTPFEAYLLGAGTYAVHIGKAILPAMTELNAFRAAAGQTPVEDPAIAAAHIIAAAILASSAQAAEVATEPKVKRVEYDQNGNITGIVG
jgi:hypothetical protein